MVLLSGDRHHIESTDQSIPKIYVVNIHCQWDMNILPIHLLDDGFTDSLFSPLLLEMIPLDLLIIFQMGWLKPPKLFFFFREKMGAASGSYC